MEVPDGWQVVRLGNVATMSHGGTPRKNQPEYWDGQIPFVTGADLTDFRISRRNARSFLTAEGLHSGHTAICEPGALLLATRTRVGLAGIAAEIMGASQDITCMIPNGQVHSDYLCRALVQLGPSLQQKSRGTTIQGITRDEVSSLPILLPPLPEQRAIAAVLDSIDEAIECTDAVITATGRLRDALLHELLTCGVPPGWHTQWKDVPGLGTIPASWEVVRLGEILESTTYGTSEPLSTRGEMVVLRMNNLQNGEIDLSEVRRADLSKKEVHELNLVPGDILFNRTNSLDLVGKVGIVRNLPELISFASYLIRLRAVASRANSFWLSALLWSPNYQSRIRKFATPGVSQANINPTSLRSLTIPLPPLQEQEATAKLLDGVDVTLAVARREREGLRLLKESITGALLAGRVRVEVGKGIHGQ